MKRKPKRTTHIVRSTLIAVYAVALALARAASAHPLGRGLSPHLNNAEQVELSLSSGLLRPSERLQNRGVDKPLAVLAGAADAALDGFGNGGKIIRFNTNEQSAFKPYRRPVTSSMLKASPSSAFQPYQQIRASTSQLTSNDRPLFDLNEPASDLDDAFALPVAPVSRTTAEADDAVHLKGSKLDSRATSQARRSTTLTVSSDPQLPPGRTTENLEVPRASTSSVSKTERPYLGGPRGGGANRVSWAAGKQPTTLGERVLQQLAWQRMQGRAAKGRKTLRWTLVKSPEWSDAKVEEALRAYHIANTEASNARKKSRQAEAAAERMKEKRISGSS